MKVINFELVMALMEATKDEAKLMLEMAMIDGDRHSIKIATLNLESIKRRMITFQEVAFNPREAYFLTTAVKQEDIA